MHGQWYVMNFLSGISLVMRLWSQGWASLAVLNLLNLRIRYQMKQSTKLFSFAPLGQATASETDRLAGFYFCQFIVCDF
jgi:hypothetical protein